MKAANWTKTAIAAGVLMSCLPMTEALSSKPGGKEPSHHEPGPGRHPGGNGGKRKKEEAGAEISAAVREFVDGQKAFSWRGLSILDKAGEPEFGQRLTVSLRGLLAACKSRVPDYIRSHPGDKVPFPEGSLLSGTYGAVHDWGIDGIATPDSRVALVRITVFSREGEGEGEGDNTPDGIVLVMAFEAGAWKADDVYYAGSDESLRTALRGVLLE